MLWLWIPFYSALFYTQELRFRLRRLLRPHPRRSWEPVPADAALRGVSAPTWEKASERPMDFLL